MSEFYSNPAAANINFSLLNLTMLIDSDILKLVDNNHQHTNFVKLIYYNKYGLDNKLTCSARSVVLTVSLNPLNTVLL